MNGQTLQRLVGKAARTLARQVKGAALVAAAIPLHDGNRGLQWAVDQVTAKDQEMLAYALLDRLHDDAAAGALTCDGCADRMARTRAAMVALRPEREVSPKHTHQ